MAYVTPTTVLTNDLIAAGDWNKNTVDNPIALRTGEIALTSQAVGDLVIATSATQLGRVADVAVGQVLVSGGVTTAPAYSASPSITALTYTTDLKSTTALATPGALSATQATAFASTVSGAAIMGFGTTNDVSLMNRAGTVVLGVGPNTTTVNMTGALSVGDVITVSGLGTHTFSAAGTNIIRLRGGTAAGYGIDLTSPTGSSSPHIDAIGSGTDLIFDINSAEKMRLSNGGNLAFNSGYGSAAIAYGCRAWVNFNSAAAIRGSGNVSSVTDNGTGDFTINFTTTMTDVNYAVTCIAGDVNISGLGGIGLRSSTAPATGNVRVGSVDGSGNAYDFTYYHYAIFR